MLLSYRWLKYFPKDRIHIVHAEAFIRTPWKELAKVETFLKIQHEIHETQFYFNQTKNFFCLNNHAKECLGSAKGHNSSSIISEGVRTL